MKIQEILAEITGLLQEKDLSCTPRFRELAAAYSAVCSELRQELDDCRELIRENDLDRAAARNLQASPPLTERVRLLQFPGLTQWQELCRLYGLDVPPDFDMELVQQLERAAGETVREKREELLAQWRTTARTGTSHEKVLLLRKMLRAIPEDPVWKKNLETAEHAWILELQKEARIARQLQDLRHLYAVYTQLTSADWSRPVPESVLAPFLPDVRTYRQQETERRRLETLQQISESYAMEDLPKLGAALACYDELSQSTSFRDDPDARVQVEEARSFHRRKTTLLEQQRLARSRQEDLNRMLDEQRPFKEIDAAYHELLQMDPFPVSEDIEFRYQERAHKEQIEDSRRARRRTFYGFLLASAGIAGAVFAIRQVQFSRSVRRIAQEMRVLLKERTPEEAVAYHEVMRKQGRKEASEESVLALRQTAERLAVKRQTEIEAFAGLLQEIRNNLANAELPEQELRFKAAERFTGEHTLQQKAELRKLRIANADLCRKRQNDRDLAFEKRAEAIAAGGKQILQELKKKDTVSIPETERQIFQLEQRSAALIGGAERVTEAVRNREKQTLKDMAALLHRTAKEVGQYQKTVFSLNAPHSIEEYVEGLRTMSRFAPEKTPPFRAAEAQLPGLETRMQIPWKDLSDPPDAVLKTVHALLLKGDPVCNDLVFILPRPDALAKIKAAVKTFQSSTLPAWDLYELSLPAVSGEYRFYLKDRNDLTVERSGGQIGGAYTSIIITYSASEQRSETVVLRLKKTLKGYLPTPHAALRRPDAFPRDLVQIPAQTLARYARHELPKAAHHSLMCRILERLQKADSLRQIRQTLWSELRECAGRKDLVPAARSRIVLQLLDWFGQLSEADQILSERIKEELRISSVSDTEWLVARPGYEGQKHQRLPRFFESGPFKILQQTAENTRRLYTGLFSRPPVPAGVLYRKGEDLVFHPFDDIPVSEEYLVLLPDEKAGTRFFRLPHTLIRKKFLPGQGLHPLYSRLRHGEIVYIPRTLDSFSRFLDQLTSGLPEAGAGSLTVFRTPESVPQEMPEP